MRHGRRSGLALMDLTWPWSGWKYYLLCWTWLVLVITFLFIFPIYICNVLLGYIFYSFKNPNVIASESFVVFVECGGFPNGVTPHKRCTTMYLMPPTLQSVGPSLRTELYPPGDRKRTLAFQRKERSEQRLILGSAKAQCCTKSQRAQRLLRQAPSQQHDIIWRATQFLRGTLTASDIAIW